jgi:hypothetical protein
MRRKPFALLAALHRAPAIASAQGHSNMSAEGLRTGARLPQQECPDHRFHAWVTPPYPEGV